MRGLRGLDVEVSCYSPALPAHAYGSREHPARGDFPLWGFFGRARARGERPVFVLEGPDAEEAAERLRATINRHPSEVLPPQVITSPPEFWGVVRGHLERWGMLEDFDEMRARMAKGDAWT